jgi:MFS family permease
MRAFTIVWAGQFVSLMGTAMTQFALSVWAWDITGQATALALVNFFGFAPTILLSPLAGALVDRWNRKLVMMLSDLAAGLSTIVIFLLYLSDSLQIWHLYIAGAFAGAFQAFQFPAYSAAISTMIPKEHYTRADAMIGVAESGSTIFAPLAAGALIGVVGIRGILLLDIVSFTAAIGTLLFVHIPQPIRTEAGRKGQGSLVKESLYGFRYIFERPSLLGLQLVFFLGNLLFSLAFTLYTPMILARTNSDSTTLGTVTSVFGIGGLIGGLVVTAWGGTKRRVHGLIGGWLGMSLLGRPLLGIGQSIPVWAAGAFLTSVFSPLIDGSNQAIWQAKVAPDVQGRVFAARRLIAQVTSPIAMLIAGPLADKVFEPGMMPDGFLAPIFGWLVGTGPGAGMGLIFVFTGLLSAAAVLYMYSFRVVRCAEDTLPDHAGVHDEPAKEIVEAATS